MDALWDTIAELFEQGIPFLWLLFGALAIVAVGSACLGAFLGTYFGTRGRNARVRSELAALEARMTDIANTLERVRRELETASVHGQRRWELKRQAYSELLEALHELRWSLEDHRTDNFIDHEKRVVGEIGKRLEQLARTLSVHGMFLNQQSTELIASLVRRYQTESQAEAGRNLISLAGATDEAYRTLCELARQDLTATQ